MWLGYVHISQLALGVRAVAHMQVSAGSEMFMLAGLAQRQLSDVEVAEVVYSAQGRLATAPEGRQGWRMLVVVGVGAPIALALDVVRFFSTFASPA